MQERVPAVVSFNEQGSRPPVVFIHTWDSDAERLRALAEFLGPDQPLYGIEPPLPVEGDMPECAADWTAYVRPRVESLPIDAPYWLAGFSFSGVVALEVARQLRADGVAVAWVGLIDTLRPRLNPKGGWRYLRYHVREVRQLEHKQQRRAYVRRLREGGTYRTKIRVKVIGYRILAALHIVKTRPKTFSAASGMSLVKRSVFRSYLCYEATPYDGPVALFSGASSRTTALGDVNLRWSNYLVGGLEVTEVTGNHLELFSPENIHSVGRAIRDSLARAQGINSTRPNADRLSK